MQKIIHNLFVALCTSYVFSEHFYTSPYGLTEVLTVVQCSLKSLVERQAQHRPDRLSKLRTGSVGTDRLGRVRKPVRRPVRRKVGSVQKPGGRWKDIPQGIYLGVSVGAL